MSDQILHDPRQMSFEFEPGVRKKDPETSHMAAAQARELAAKHHRLIVDVLNRHGRGGKDFIASRCGITGVQVARRMKELAKSGLVHPTGKNSLSTAGRPETEWELTSCK